jgi:hypothetical protein
VGDNSVGKTTETLLRHDLIIVGLCRRWHDPPEGGPGQGGLLGRWLISATGIVTGF